MKKEVKASWRADRFTVLRAINGSPAARRVSPLSPEASSSPLGAQATPPGNQAGLWYPSPTKNKGTCTLTYGSGPRAKREGLSLPGGGGEEKGKQLVGADRAMKWWKQLRAFDFRVWHLLRHDGKEWGKDLGEECKLLKRSWMHGPGGWRETNCSLVKSCCSLWAAPAHLRESSLILYLPAVDRSGNAQSFSISDRAVSLSGWPGGHHLSVLCSTSTQLRTKLKWTTLSFTPWDFFPPLLHHHCLLLN